MHEMVVVLFCHPLVEITCISKQYWVSGQSGFLTGDWDGDWDGVLPNASGSSGTFWLQFMGWRCGPPSGLLVPGFCSSRSLDLMQPLTQKTVAMNWNCQMNSYNWAQGPTQENKDTNELTVTTSFPWWIRDLFICHQWIPSQMWGTLPIREKGTHQPTQTTRVVI